MMDCRTAQAMMSAYHDGELPGSDRARVASHLLACADCAALLESLEKIDAATSVPEPGPEYWESFNRRVQERVAQDDVRKDPVVVRPPRRGWTRQQIRYLVPAAAAAVLVVAVVRNSGIRPGPPASPAPPAPRAASKFVPEEHPAPRKAIPSPGAAAPAPSARTAPVPASPAPPTFATRVPESPEMVRPAVEDERIAGAGRARSERSLQTTEPEAESRIRNEDAAGAAEMTAPGEGRKEGTAKSADDRSRRKGGSPCEESRLLAAQGRFRDAETAQRACLAAQPSAPAQESGLVFLAELLDRQHRFAEADSVIEDAQTRFPRSRSLELYQERREKVQSGRIPYTSEH